MVFQLEMTLWEVKLFVRLGSTSMPSPSPEKASAKRIVLFEAVAKLPEEGMLESSVELRDVVQLLLLLAVKS